MQENSPATFTLIPIRELFGFLIRGLPLTILCVAVAVGAVWVTIRNRPLTWTANAYLLSVRQEHAPTVVPGIVPGSLDPTLYRNAVAEGPVLAELRAAWNPGGVELPDDRTLLSKLRVESDNQLQSSVVRVSYRDENPVMATDIVNIVAEGLVEWDRERTLGPLEDWYGRLSREIAELDERIAEAPPESEALRLERDERVARLAELRAAVPLSQLSLLRPADLPAEPDGQGLMSSAAIAAVFGTIAGYLLRLLMLARRQRPAVQES